MENPIGGKPQTATKPPPYDGEGFPPNRPCYRWRGLPSAST